jgi:MoxR-like ATPase
MQTLINKVVQQVNSAVLGKPKQVLLSLSCLLARGHLLIEDLPGMGKTTLAHALAKTLGLSYQRVQFTSDLLPADILGISVYKTEIGFEFHPGPIFNHVVLADEVNRASPKTQSALLEAMEENQVSVDGITHTLPKPFFVIATQNPQHHLGTFPLPESQLDRFLARITLGFPDKAAEFSLLGQDNISVSTLEACLCAEELINIQHQVEQVSVSTAVKHYIIALVTVTRQSGFAANPLSPRASKSLLAMAKAWAYIHGRNYITPDDVQAVFASVAEHRLGQTMVTSVKHGSLSATILAQVDVVDTTS